MIWTPNDWLNKFYVQFFRAVIVLLLVVGMAIEMKYRKRVKIHWAKLSRIHYMKFFTGKLLWSLIFKTLKQCSLYNICM